MQVPKISLPARFTSLPKEKKIQIGVISVLVIALIPTIIAAKTIQNLNSQADEKKAIASCEKIDLSLLNTEASPAQVPQLVSTAQAADRNLNQAIRDYMQQERQEEREKKKDKKESAKEKKRDQDRKQAQRQYIRQMAMTRKKAVIELLYADPNNALNLSKGDKQKEGYYLLEDNCKVTPKKIQGELVISIAENPREKKMTEFYEIVTPNGDDIAIHNTSGIAFESIEPNSTVNIDGLSIDDEIIFESPAQRSVALIAPPGNLDGRSSGGGGPNNTRISGKQRVLVIFAHFSNNPPPGVMKNNDGKYVDFINNFYNQVPNGVASASVDRTGWIQIDKDLRNKCGLYSRSILRKILNEADKKVNFNNYDHLVITAPFGGGACAGTVGYGTIGKKRVKTADGFVKLSIARVDAHDEVSRNMTQADGLQYMSETAVHEMGHGYGMYHADAIECGSPPPRVIDLDTCYITSYDDWFDQMGVVGGMFNASHLNYLGWLSDQQLKTVSEGTYTLEPLTSRSNGLKAVRIPRGDDDYVYIEFRQPINPDDTFQNTYPSWLGYVKSNIYKGALLHIQGKGKRHSSRVRATILITPMNTRLDYPSPAFEVGKTFTDSKTGTTVYVKSITPAGLTIEVYPRGKGPVASPSAALTVAPSLNQKPPLTPTPTRFLTPTVKPSLTPYVTKIPSVTTTPAYSLTPTASYTPAITSSPQL